MASASQMQSKLANSAESADVAHLAAGYTQMQRLLEMAGVTAFFGLTSPPWRA